MKFGVRADEEVSGGGNNQFVRYMNEDGEYRFRFLEEYPSHWTSFWEHFSAAYKCGYPCTREKDCPGCAVEDERESKATRRLMVNAVLVSTTSKKSSRGVGYSGLWKFPASSVEPTVKRAYERTETVRDRDFTIIRYTEGQTKYDVEREDTEVFDATKYALIDHDEALQAAYDYRWDEKVRNEVKQRIETAIADREAKANAEEKKQEVTPQPEPEVPYELLSKEEREAKDKESHPSPKRRLTVAPEPEEQDEDLSVTPGQVRAMSVPELKKLFRKAGIELPEDESKENLLKVFFEEMSAGV